VCRSVWFEGAGGGNHGGQLQLLYDVPRMVAQLEGVERGAGAAYLRWLADARLALEVGEC
jgi:hypothetical protein